MKGIILAGGTGSRLWPLTKTVSKQLLPVYDKPMIYYPLTTLMQAGIKDILIITTPDDNPQFRRLLADGTQWGINITYATQPRPEGLAQAFIIARDYIADNPVAMILGDNIYHGTDLAPRLAQAAANTTQNKATIFLCQVNDPQRYGVAQIAPDGTCTSIEEKPTAPRSNLAVTGLYFYPPGVADIAAQITPSPRGELEITSLNNAYLQTHRLLTQTLPPGFAWLDTGTFDSLTEATSLIQTIQNRQGTPIGCPETTAHTLGWITTDQLRNIAATYPPQNPYGQLLLHQAANQ